MIPAEYYLTIYNILILIVTAATALFIIQKVSASGTASPVYLGFVVLIITFIGTRPIDGAFVDMVTYANRYEAIKIRDLNFSSDFLFLTINLVMSAFLQIDVHGFFLLCAFIYIIMPAIAMRRVHGDAALVALVCIVGSFQFFAYGVNTIRSGMAASVAILAFSFDRKYLFMLLFSLVAFSLHSSLLLPILFFIISGFFDNLLFFVFFWLLCLTLSIVYGESMTTYIASFTPEMIDGDDRLARYSLGGGADKGGFRWDFIFYSITPILASWFLADKKAKADLLYRRLICTFIGTNAFWLLLIYAAYSDRIAYLSWFILPWVTVFPFLPNRAQPDGLGNKLSKPSEEFKLSILLFSHFLFTFLFWIIRSNA